MNRKMFWAMTLLLSGLVTAGTAAAQESDDAAARAPWPRMERLADRLDLTEAQSAQIDKLHEDGRAAATELRKEMIRLRNDLHGEMLKDEPDLAAVKRLAGKIGEVQTQLDIHRLETQLAVRKVLTPEQRDRMILMQERGPRMGKAGRHGGGRRAPFGAFQGMGHHPGAWGGAGRFDDCPREDADGARPGCGHGGHRARDGR